MLALRSSNRTGIKRWHCTAGSKKVHEIGRIRRMSPRELAFLGIQDIAYVRRVEINGSAAYAVHAADGSQIAVLADRSVAFATVRQHDLEPLSVH
jgi:hypothetical protein